MHGVGSGVVLRLDSSALHDIGFFDENELESLFYSLVLVVSFSSYGRFFSHFQRSGSRDFIHNYMLPRRNKCNTRHDLPDIGES
jgi:hypothetical protein